MVHYGVGRHQFYIEASPKLSRQLPRALELLAISEILIILSTMFTRVSISFFLLRIFGKVQSWKYSLYGIVASTVAVSIFSVITEFVQCSPPQKTWNSLIPGNCWSYDARLAVGRINGGGLYRRPGLLTYMC